MKKLVAFLLACASCVFAFAAVGCSAPKTDKDIFAISYNLSDPNMSGLWKPGLEQASVDLGFNKISLQDAKNDNAEAVKMVEAAATESYGGYLINVVDHTNGTKYLNTLKNTGKAVVFWNREVGVDVLKSYDKAYYVGIESAEGGRYQGQMAAEYVNTMGFDKLDRNKDGKLGVIVVRGEKGHLDAEARTLYAPMYLERFLTGGNTQADAEVSDTNYNYKNAWNKVEVKAIVDGTDTANTSWDPVTAANEVSRVLTEKGDEIDLVLSNNDGMALGIVTNTSFKNSGIPIWGVDALSDALTEIKKENTQFMGTVRNDGVSQAKVCVQVVKNILEGKDYAEGMEVVDTKEEWEANGNAIWKDAANKALRVHHTKITKANA